MKSEYDNNSNSSDSNSGYFMPHPGQDDKNRNNVGGTDKNRSLNRFSYTSNSTWSSSNVESGNFRSKPKRQYPNSRH